MRKEIVALLVICIGFSVAAPQGDDPKEEVKTGEEPQAYNYNWEVKDDESKNYYGQEQTSDDAGRVEGKYFVWLADGRLMTVSYYVDGDSGFVPKITFSDPDFVPEGAPAKPS